MNKPTVLFVVLPYADAQEAKRSYAAMPYGPLIVATYCKEKADIKILDCNVEPDFRGLLADTLAALSPDIVAFSMLFDVSYQYLEELLTTVILDAPSAMTILGGAASSYSYQEILLRHLSLDAICYGEGEIPMSALIDEMYLRGQEGARNFIEEHESFVTHINLRDAGASPKISYIQDLDQVIEVDYSFVGPWNYAMREAFSPFSGTKEKGRQFYLATSRGCPYSCQFCSNAKIHGKRMRYASIDKIISHVRYLVNDYGMNVLTLYDDQLLMNQGRAKELFGKLAEFNLRIEAPNGFSVKYIDDELAGLMRKAGMDTIFLAIESGSDYVLKHVIHKPLVLGQVQPVIDVLRKYDFYIHGFFVIGMPGETDAHRDETIQSIRRWGLDWCGFNAAMPFRGSPLYEQCVANRWISPKSIGDYDDKDHRTYIIEAPEIGLTPDKISDWIYETNLEINFVENQRMKMGDYGTAANAFTEVLRRDPSHALAWHYLGRCLAAQHRNTFGELLCKHRFEELVKTEEKWTKYARRFNLIPEGENINEQKTDRADTFQEARRLLRLH